MPKHEQSTRGGEYRARGRDHSRERYAERGHRVEQDRDHRRRRQRSPSYDSSDSGSYDSGSSRNPSPRRPTRRHTAAPPAYSDSEDREYRDRGRDHRRQPARQYYSEESRSRSRERGGLVEDLLAAVGLIQSKNKDRPRQERSRSRGGEGNRKNTQKAIQAALTAAAMEAFRTRKEGKLTPQRLMQIAGAAIAAGGLDALVDRSGGSGGNGGGSMRSIIESVVASLAAGKAVKHGREEGIASKVGSGMVGLAAKTLARSMSQGPTRRRTNKY
ncbi:hypothetical protein DRE_02932 [Drechslerella stenobrocha 248]|uniref:Uncharacterized protein n=1 Tax=Drechslerella stenobrocha 248 TaxID=1043628 RepID=W7I5I6_9PEZI|nr:hypothetical protein DRE_02932 [Drechslerella stenobrocha 248]